MYLHRASLNTYIPSTIASIFQRLDAFFVGSPRVPHRIGVQLRTGITELAFARATGDDGRALQGLSEPRDFKAGDALEYRFSSTGGDGIVTPR
jgi:hypothetical protein